MKVNIHKKKILSLATAGVILVTGTGIILDKSNIPEDYTSHYYALNYTNNNLSKLNIKYVDNYDYSNLSKDYIPQGYATNNYKIFISAYHKYKELNSKIFVIDPITNVTNTIILNNKDHVGGLSIDTDNNILFVTSNNGKISSYDLNKINEELSKSNTINIEEDMVIPNDINNNTYSISSIYTNNNKLYTTTYGEKCILKEIEYELNDGEIKHKVINTKELNTPCVQGITIYNNYLILSSSAGIFKETIKIPSKISIYDLNNKFELKSISYIKQSGLEGIDVDNKGNISGIFELEDKKIKNIGKVQSLINYQDNELLKLNEDKFNKIYKIIGNFWEKTIPDNNKKIKL